MIAKITMVLAFAAIAIIIGILCQKHAGSVTGFILGGRNVGPWLSAFAFGTSYFSAVIFVGYAGQFGWKYGLSATWVGIGNAILGSLLAWWVLGPRTREMTQRLGAATMPEFFGKRYHSRALRIAAAAIIFVFLIPYTASVYNGLSRLFGMAFGLPYEACVIGMALITCIYVVLGGYMATVVNDFLQGIVMLFGITAVICAVLAGNGGFSQAVIDLSHVQAETNSDLQGAFVSMFGPDLFNLLGVVVLTSLGTWGLPQMVQKFYAITKWLKPIKQAPFYGIHRHIRLSTIVHGVNVNGEMQVLDKDGNPIEGLYSIGNCAGNFFGSPDYPMDLPGLSLGRCHTQGYVVGKMLGSK